MNRMPHLMLIRIIATALVVLFHSYEIYFYDIGFEWEKVGVEMPYNPFYKKVFICEELVQMPLFVFLSGWLFGYSQFKHKYKTIKSVIVKKANRLLIPYVFWGGIYLIVSPLSSGVLTIEWLTAIGHLWFLPMLFWCFVLQFALSKHLDFKYILIISIVMELVNGKVPNYLCLGSTFRYFIYFTCAYFYGNTDIKLVENKFIQWLLFVIVIVGAYFCVTLDSSFLLLKNWEISPVRTLTFISTPYMKIFHHLLIIIVPLSICVLIFYFTKAVEEKLYNRLMLKCVEKFDKLTFGIYLIHYPFMLLFLSFFCIAKFASIHKIVYPIMMFSFLMIMSGLVVSIIKQTKIGNKLM